jgi:nicotinate-nucleotide adenylyltransferase
MIGIYGGTFNPIHLGHLRAAEEVLEALGLDRMVFVPSARPPHKHETDGDVIAPAKLRLEWVEIAVRDNPRFEVDALEVEREGPSYLVDTLENLRRRHVGEEIVFVLGRDAFQDLGSWREPRRLLELAHFAVTTRPPVQAGALSEWTPDCVRDDLSFAPDGRSARHRRSGAWLRLLEITPLEISASDIRARLRDGASVRYLLPDAVAAAVVASGCYKIQGPGGSASERRT